MCLLACLLHVLQLTPLLFNFPCTALQHLNTHTPHTLNPPPTPQPTGAGVVRRWRTPRGASSFTAPPLSGPAAGIRVDSGVREGDIVGTHYDPMIAKVIGGGGCGMGAVSC